MGELHAGLAAAAAKGGADLPAALDLVVLVAAIGQRRTQPGDARQGSLDDRERVGALLLQADRDIRLGRDAIACAELAVRQAQGQPFTHPRQAGMTTVTALVTVG